MHRSCAPEVLNKNLWCYFEILLYVCYKCDHARQFIRDIPCMFFSDTFLLSMHVSVLFVHCGP